MSILRKVNEFFHNEFLKKQVCNDIKNTKDKLGKILGYNVSDGLGSHYFVDINAYDLMTNEEKSQFSQIMPKYEKTIDPNNLIVK